MEYPFNFWQDPVPASVDEAFSIMHRLDSRPGPQNPLFAELARRLTARYPCPTTIDEAEEETVWSDGPVEVLREGPLWGVGVKAECLEEAMPFVIDTARSLGLPTFDPTHEQVFLADGRVLTQPGMDPRLPQPEPPNPLIELSSEASKLVREELRTMMEAEGFKTLKGEVAFRRSYRDCNHDVYICFGNGDRHGYTVEFSYWVQIKAPAALRRRIEERGRRIKPLFVDFKALLCEVPDPPLQENSSTGLEWSVGRPYRRRGQAGGARADPAAGARRDPAAAAAL